MIYPAQSALQHVDICISNCNCSISIALRIASVGISGWPLASSSKASEFAIAAIVLHRHIGIKLHHCLLQGNCEDLVKRIAVVDNHRGL